MTFDQMIQLSGLDPSRDLRFEDWSDVDFSHCDLRGYDFSYSCLLGSKFQGALIDKAVFYHAEMNAGQLADAIGEPRRKGDDDISFWPLEQKLGAAVAEMLNTAGRGGAVTLDPARVRKRLLKLLCGGAYDKLIGVDALADRSRKEAAEIFFGNVLERRLFLVRDVNLQIAHEVFLALCQRGRHVLWKKSKLVRSRYEVNIQGVAPDEFALTAKRLAKLPMNISDDNPARYRQAAAGPLYLRVPGGRHEVSEEMSLWGAIECAPRRLCPLVDRSEYNAFCSLLARAIEMANGRYRALIRRPALRRMR